MILELIIIGVVGLLIIRAIFMVRLTDQSENGIRVIINPEDAEDALTSDEKNLLKLAEGKVMLLLLDGVMNPDISRSIDKRNLDPLQYESVIIDMSNVTNLGPISALEIDECIKNFLHSNKKILIVYSEIQTVTPFHSLQYIPGNMIVKKRRQAIKLAINENYRKPMVI